MTGLACESGRAAAATAAGRQFAQQTKAGDCSELSQGAGLECLLKTGGRGRTPTVPAAAPEASSICLISLSLLCYQDTAAAGAREDTSERTHAHRTGPALCILSRQLASPLAASCICKRCATCSSRQPCPGPRPVIQSEPS